MRGRPHGRRTEDDAAARCEKFSDRRLPGLLDALGTTPAGLTSGQAQRRLRLHGPNALAQEARFAALIGFLRLFANPFVIVLLVTSVISIALSDPVGGLIIIAMVLLTVLLNSSWSSRRVTRWRRSASRWTPLPPSSATGRRRICRSRMWSPATSSR